MASVGDKCGSVVYSRIVIGQKGRNRPLIVRGKQGKNSKEKSVLTPKKKTHTQETQNV